MSLLDRRLSRRDFLRTVMFAGVVLETASLAACRSSQPVLTQAERAKLEGKPPPESVESRLKAEVKRIAENVLRKGDPEQVDSASYFLGRPSSDIRSSFLPLEVYFWNEPGNKAFAITYFAPTGRTDERGVLYRSNVHTPVIGLTAVTNISVKMGFTPAWLNNSSDQVKALVMHKELLHLKVWPILARNHLRLAEQANLIRYQENPFVQEKEDTVLDYAHRDKTKDTLKLLDYSAYLLVWPWMKRIIQGSSTEARGLELTDFPDIYRKAQVRGLDFNITLDSPDFYYQAFNPNSDWVKLVNQHTTG